MERVSLGIAIVAVGVCISGCTKRTPVRTPASTPPPVLRIQEGLASYYGKEFHGKRTASGALFNMNAMVAAHPSYPFGTELRVVNVGNGRSIQVRVVDRGPSSGPQAGGVIIDLSRAAAQALGFIQKGRARVRVEVLRWGS